jgi:hypothetical protein
MTIEVFSEKELVEVKGINKEAIAENGVLQFHITGYAEDEDMSCLMETIFTWAKKHNVPVHHKPL